MRHEAATAVLKVSWPAAWLSGWAAGINWGTLVSIATLIYTVLMIVHLLVNWNKSRDTPDEPLK